MDQSLLRTITIWLELARADVALMEKQQQMGQVRMGLGNDGQQNHFPAAIHYMLFKKWKRMRGCKEMQKNSTCTFKVTQNESFVSLSH